MATPTKPRYEIKAQADERHAEVLIFGVIGTSYWEESVEAAAFVQQIEALDVDTMAVRINSPGGSVFDGIAIYNALVRHQATITTYVEGQAASIASFLLFAGEHRVCSPSGMVMIHKPWTCACGNEDDLIQCAGVLGKIGEVMVRAYARRAGIDADAIRTAMKETTWYDADEALAVGFVDEIGDDVAVAAMGTLDIAAMSRGLTPDRIAAVAAFDGVLDKWLEDPTDEIPEITAVDAAISEGNTERLRKARAAIDAVLSATGTVPTAASEPVARDTRDRLEVERTAALLARTQV